MVIWYKLPTWQIYSLQTDTVSNPLPKNSYQKGKFSPIRLLLSVYIFYMWLSFLSWLQLGIFFFFKLELWEVIQSLAKRYTAYFLKGDINFIVQRSCNSFNFPCLAWLDLQFFSSGEKWILFCYFRKLIWLDWKLSLNFGIAIIASFAVCKRMFTLFRERHFPQLFTLNLSKYLSFSSFFLGFQLLNIVRRAGIFFWNFKKSDIVWCYSGLQI